MSDNGLRFAPLTTLVVVAIVDDVASANPRACDANDRHECEKQTFRTNGQICGRKM